MFTTYRRRLNSREWFSESPDIRTDMQTLNGASTPLFRNSGPQLLQSHNNSNQEPEWKATELYGYPRPANLAGGANPDAMEPIPAGSAGQNAHHAAIG